METISAWSTTRTSGRRSVGFERLSVPMERDDVPILRAAP